MGIGNDRPQTDQDQADLDMLKEGVEGAKRRLREGRMDQASEEPTPKRRSKGSKTPRKKR